MACYLQIEIAASPQWENVVRCRQQQDYAEIIIKEIVESYLQVNFNESACVG